MNRINVGIIGTGWCGGIRADACFANPLVADLHIAEVREERLREVEAAAHAVSATTDYRLLIDNPDIDALIISATPETLHFPMARQALSAGKHVFLEKPMADSVAACRKIVDAAAKAKGHLMVGHICRFNPRYAAAKQEIAAGKIGKIVSLYARRNIPASVTTEILNKIGPIIGDGVHDTDLMLWYSGDRIVSAYAQTVDVRGKKYPDLGWTMYRFAGGAVGVLENVWCLPDHTAFQIDERMEIIGTEGSIHIQETHPNFSICDANGWQSPDTTYWPELHGVRSGALRDELVYFADCIHQKRPPEIITPPESMSAVEACLAAEQSAATSSVVTLP